MADMMECVEELAATLTEARRVLRIRTGKSISESKLLDRMDAVLARYEASK